MTFREIKISELVDFIASDFYKNSSVIPISPQRAISQSKNPNSQATDVALILALDTTENIIGYIGIMPGKINNDVTPYFWNSCWWVHPKKGKLAAMPLFYKMLKLSNKKMVFFELTETTKNIVAKFKFKTDTVEGFKGFLRFNFTQIIPRKNKNLTFIKPILQYVDWILNGVRNIQLSKFKTLSDITITPIEKIDTEAEKFIDSFKESQLIPTNKIEINWMIESPWIISDSSELDEQLAKKYYFSSLSKSFSNSLYKVYKNDQLIAVLFFSTRDNDLKIPYAFFNESDSTSVSKAIYSIAINNKVASLTCFNDTLIKEFQTPKNLFILNKQLHKNIAYPADLNLEGKTIQDGDGDAVFC